ncbi:unnamed protein product [Amaranthus hypochondriacus]
MIFEELEKACDFYTGYARYCGFDIRSATTYKSKGVIVLKYFVCSREGFMRYNQEKLNVSSLHTVPQLKTPLPIEKHASELYTRIIFFLFQYEVYKSSFKTYIQSIEKSESVETIVVLDSVLDKMYKVTFIAGSSIDELQVDFK